MSVAGPQHTPYTAVTLQEQHQGSAGLFSTKGSHSAIFRERDQGEHFESQNQYTGAKFPPKDSES